MSVGILELDLRNFIICIVGIISISEFAMKTFKIVMQKLEIHC